MTSGNVRYRRVKGFLPGNDNLDDISSAVMTAVTWLARHAALPDPYDAPEAMNPDLPARHLEFEPFL